MAQWLVKEEPDHYGYGQLERDGKTVWAGVKNPLAQKHLRAIRQGDRVFYYHTGKEKAVVAIARAASDAYPDPADATGKAYVVDIVPVAPLARPVTLAEIKAVAAVRVLSPHPHAPALGHAGHRRRVASDREDEPLTRLSARVSAAGVATLAICAAVPGAGRGAAGGSAGGARVATGGRGLEAVGRRGGAGGAARRLAGARLPRGRHLRADAGPDAARQRHAREVRLHLPDLLDLTREPGRAEGRRVGRRDQHPARRPGRRARPSRAT